MSVEEERAVFIQRAMMSEKCFSDRCNKCGSVRPGFYNIMDRTFKCLVCAAEEKYPETPKLDYEDFVRI